VSLRDLSITRPRILVNASPECFKNSVGTGRSWLTAWARAREHTSPRPPRPCPRPLSGRVYGGCILSITTICGEKMRLVLVPSRRVLQCPFIRLAPLVARRCSRPPNQMQEGIMLRTAHVLVSMGPAWKGGAPAKIMSGGTREARKRATRSRRHCGAARDVSSSILHLGLTNRVRRALTTSSAPRAARSVPNGRCFRTGKSAPGTQEFLLQLVEKAPRRGPQERRLGTTTRITTSSTTTTRRRSRTQQLAPLCGLHATCAHDRTPE
jgi:hypothetical protein